MRNAPGAAWTRRGFLSLAASAMAARRAAAPGRAGVPASTLQAEPVLGIERGAVVAIAHAVLPHEIGIASREAAADDFLGWVRGYQADAEMDHGYGFTRLRRTAEHPAATYRDDIARLDDVARDGLGSSFMEIAPEQARTLIEADLEALRPELDLPSRPSGGHIAIDMIAQWARSAGAVDLCYEARIGRETCRGLFVDVDGPAPLDESNERR